MSSQIHPRKRAMALVFACASLLACGVALVSPMPGMQGTQTAAAQLLEGPGHRIPHDLRLSMVGAYRAPDGSLAYCLEWGQEPPSLLSDPAHTSSVITTYEDWGSEEIARVNWLIGTHGQTVNNDQAAAVGVAIWLRHPGGPDPFRVDHPFFIAAIPDAAVRGGIVAEARRLSGLMDAYRYVAPQAGGELRIEQNVDDPLLGDVVLSALPSGASGLMSIDGAEFVASGVASRSVQLNERVQYRLLPEDDELARSEVRVAATLTLPGGAAGPALKLWHSAPALQDVVAVGPVETDLKWTLRANETHSLVFSPELTTQVPTAVIEAGEPLADSFQLSLAPESAPWRRLRDGSALPVTVTCRAYGPFEAPQDEAAEVPHGLEPVTAPFRTQVGGGLEDPLAAPIDFTYDYVPVGGGYFTSVCGVDAADQDDSRSAAALPVGYRFADAFGLSNETQFAPIGVRFNTTLSDAEVHPGAMVVDVIVGESVDGPWASWAGEQLAVPLVGTVYWSESRPERMSEPPVGAEAVATVQAQLTGPGLRAEALIALPDTPGWYTVRWCTDPEASSNTESGGAPLVRFWCDDYGVPSETVHAIESTVPPSEPPVRLGGLVSTGAESGAVGVTIATIAAVMLAGLSLGGLAWVRRISRIPRS